MPTKRPRHMITETDAVERALAPLRRRGVKIDFGELVCRGAMTKLREIEDEHEAEKARDRLRRRFAERTLSGEGFDLDVVLEVRDRAWTHP